jgi:hypothetical protein
LVDGYVPPPPKEPTAAMDTEATEAKSSDEGAADAKTATATTGTSAALTITTPPKALGRSTAVAVEAWLLSLAVRILWKQGQCAKAAAVAEQAIAIVMQHLNNSGSSSAYASVAGSSSSSSSVLAAALFPLLARLYRWSALVNETMNQSVAATATTSSTTALSTVNVVAMARAHNLATLRRDVDTQATLLNIMMRHLLAHSQGKKPINLFGRALDVSNHFVGLDARWRQHVSSLTQTFLLAPFIHSVLLHNSRRGAKALEQFVLSRNGVQQSIVPLLVLQWPRPGVALGIYRRLFQFKSMLAQGTDQYGHWLYHCRATIVCRGAIAHGRNSRSYRLFYQELSNGTQAILGHYRGGPSW